MMIRDKYGVRFVALQYVEAVEHIQVHNTNTGLATFTVGMCSGHPIKFGFKDSHEAQSAFTRLTEALMEYEDNT